MINSFHLWKAELLRDQEHLRQLMGDSTQDQRAKLQERLKRRRERLAQGNRCLQNTLYIYSITTVCSLKLQSAKE